MSLGERIALAPTRPGLAALRHTLVQAALQCSPPLLTREGVSSISVAGWSRTLEITWNARACPATRPVSPRGA